MSVERFILGLGGAGRNVMIDASGRLICNAGGGDRLPFMYGDTGRALVVDPSGRLMVNLDGTGGGGGGGASTASQLSMVDASGFYPTHNGEAAFALCGSNDKSMRTDINKQRTDFTNASGVWPKTATAMPITDAGNYYGTHNVEAALQTAGQKNKDFTNASGVYIKTITGASGIIATKSGSTYALKEQILIAKPFKTLTSATALTFDLAQFNNYYLPLAHDAVITFANPSDGQKILVVIKQTVGSNTVTWPAAVKWRGGVAPIISPTINYIDCVTLIYNSSLGIYLADIGQNFA